MFLQGKEIRNLKNPPAAGQPPPTVGSGVVRDSEKSEVTDLDDFRPRITMGNPIVTEILGFSDVGFSKNEKFSAKKSKK